MRLSALVADAYTPRRRRHDCAELTDHSRRGKEIGGRGVTAISLASLDLWETTCTTAEPAGHSSPTMYTCTGIGYETDDAAFHAVSAAKGKTVFRAEGSLDSRQSHGST